MYKNRRVGTLSVGIMLIAFGVLFVVRTLNVEIDYKIIFSLWPVILVLIGIELLLAGLLPKDDRKIKYDGGAIAIFIVLTIFAMVMAVAEFAITHSQDWQFYF